MQQERYKLEPTDTPSGFLAVLWGEKASCLAPSSVAPHPKAGPPRPPLYCSSFPLPHPLSLGFHDVLRVLPPPPPTSRFPSALLFLTSGPSAWQLFRADSQFPQKSRSPTMVCRPGPPWVTQSLSLTLGAGGLVTHKPYCSLSKPGNAGQAGRWSVSPDFAKQRLEMGVGCW